MNSKYETFEVKLTYGNLQCDMSGLKESAGGRFLQNLSIQLFDYMLAIPDTPQP
jgi:hypothetical protein